MPQPLPTPSSSHLRLPTQDNLRGIVAMVLAVGCFALMDALLKTLAAHYPAMQVAALRGLSALPLAALYVAWRGEARMLLRVRWPLHLLRGTVNVGMLALFAYALRTLALTQAYAIFFVAPLLITALSTVVLGEHVRRAHWVAIGLGLAGVLVALRPGGAGFWSWGALAMLAAAGGYAVSAVAGRLLARTDSTTSLVFWATALLAAGAGALAAPQWQPMPAAHWPLIAGLAVTGFLGQLAITEAFRHGQAAVVAPFEYTALAWGLGLDWLLWRSVPDATTLVGAAIIVASGVSLVRRERAQAVLPP